MSAKRRPIFNLLWRERTDSLIFSIFDLLDANETCYPVELSAKRPIWRGEEERTYTTPNALIFDDPENRAHVDIYITAEAIARAVVGRGRVFVCIGVRANKAREG